MKSLSSAVVLLAASFVLASACSSSPHNFNRGKGDSAGNGGSGGSVTPGVAGSGVSSGGSAAARGGSAGNQAQTSAGTSQGLGGAPPDEGGAAGMASAGEGGAGGDPECLVGQHETCWELENGTPIAGARPTEGVGSCHIGERYCAADSSWGPCLGAVGPKAKDDCDTAGNDDDCDGKPNGGCDCVTGTKRSCGSDVGTCAKGQQTCVAQVWGKCDGEVTAQALDSCLEAGNDDSCNGKANEGCPCIGDQVEACGSCGMRKCSAATRQWGACLPAASECTGPTQVRDCSAQGEWVASTCQFACVDGQCTGSCVPGTHRCVANPERRQDCNDQGIWTTAETCAGNKLCSGGGTTCVTPCAGQKLCPGNICVPLGGCCSSSECANGFACTNGTCSTTSCQQGLRGPCGGVCTSGCCAVTDCPDKPNMGRACNGSHQCTYACKFNYGNCDGDDANGCEVNLLVGTPNGIGVKDCGVCTSDCDFTNPEGGSDCHTLANTCSGGECRATFKPIGDTTDEFAYYCPVRRVHASLRRGDCNIGCTYDCDVGYKDCDNIPGNGCETANANADANCYPDAFWPGDR